MTQIRCWCNRSLGCSCSWSEEVWTKGTHFLALTQLTYHENGRTGKLHSLKMVEHGRHAAVPGPEQFWNIARHMEPVSWLRLSSVPRLILDGSYFYLLCSMLCSLRYHSFSKRDIQVYSWISFLDCFLPLGVWGFWGIFHFVTSLSF